MKKENYWTHSVSYSPLCILLVCVSMLISVLSLSSCRAKKEVAQIDVRSQKQEAIVEKMKVSSQTIPTQSARLTISEQDLKALALAAQSGINPKLTDRNGRASLEVTVKDSLIYITANCDSLQRLIFEHERSINTLWAENSKLERKIRNGPGFRDLIKSFFMGIITGIITILILRRK